MTPNARVRARLGTALLLSVSAVLVEGEGQKYQPKDQVDLWVNKVGPYANPQEAYEYYTLPYCSPSHAVRQYNERKSHSLAEILGGHSLRSSGHNLQYRSPVQKESCTTKKLTEADAVAFGKAAEEDWFYQMFLDDLPIWGMVGEVLPRWDNPEAQKEYESKLRHGESDREALRDALSPDRQAKGFSLHPYVYTDRTLTVSFNGDRIVQADLVSDPQSLTRPEAGKEITFSLTVEWKETTDEFRVRFDRYLDHEFFRHQIHWFSIFNSFMMVLFLTGLVALILLRTLRKDYARYSRTEVVDPEEGEVDSDGESTDAKPLTAGASLNEDSGWKQVHGDVFRAPPALPLFSAILGIGWQIIVLTGSVILFALLGPLHGDVHEERGEVTYAVLGFYCLSSVVAGLASGSFYKRFRATSTGRRDATDTSLTMGSRAWQGVLLLTAGLFPTIVMSVLLVLDIVSLSYGTINSLPPLVLIKLFFLWAIVSVPLAVVGTLLGRHAVGKGSPFPCRVNSIPRPIPDDVPWYGEPKHLIPLAGLLPFGSVFIELYYVLTSLWNYKVYHVYGFLLGMFLILAVVVSMTSVIATYFCLNAENHRWQWASFASGASTAMYVFAYGAYYFLTKTSMHGFYQTVHYFSYMFLISLTMATACGTLGYCASERFVKTIFQNVKLD